MQLKKYKILLVALCCAAAPTIAQMRYKDMIFPEFVTEKNLSYSEGRQGLFDLYRPKSDSAAQRPLMIWMHGGGFKFGSKDASGTRLWCETFARRGYVCAAINYRLGKKNLSFTFTDLVNNCFQGVQGVRKAIAFFKANAVRWNIDTTRIILAGNSAGGMLALQTAYSTDAGLKALLGGTQTPSSTVQTGGIAAIVNFWGGIFDTSWLKQARVPIVSVHGQRDGIVPYDHKGYPLYGSLPIHRMADSLHLPNALRTYEGYSHELQKHFFPLFVNRRTKKRWLEAGQFAADFLFQTLGE